VLSRLAKFLYFDIGFWLRYWFWKFLIHSSGGRLGKGAKLYGGVRIVGNAPGAISIGDDVRILRNATLATAPGGKIMIGDRVHIGEGTIIFSHLSITIGNDVIIGPQNVIVDSDHHYHDLSIPMNQQGLSLKEVSIEDDVWIPSNCVITKGVTIQKGAIIGAGSVVTRDIPSYTIAVGVPARVIKKREDS
jgi:acetyltransferase-like isoleucine patch superfamily enzyme